MLGRPFHEKSLAGPSTKRAVHAQVRARFARARHNVARIMQRDERQTRLQRSERNLLVTLAEKLPALAPIGSAGGPVPQQVRACTALY